MILALSTSLWTEPAVSAKLSPRGAAWIQSTAQAQKYPELLLGQIVEREFPGGTSQHYRFTLSAGQYARVVAEQIDSDFGLAVYDPNGREIVTMNRLDLTRGPEFAEMVAEISGEYHLHLFSNNTGRPGRYRLSIAELRQATPEDQKRNTAARLRTEGLLTQRNPTEEAYRQAIAMHEEAIRLWHSVGDLVSEGDTLQRIGLAYFTPTLFSLEEPVKALEYYHRALETRRVAGDRYGEAETLFSLARIYSLLTGEIQKGFDYYQLALQRCREFGDRHYEAHALNNLGAIYSSLGDYQKALDHYQQALHISIELENHFGEANRLGNMATVYRLMGEPQKALDHYQKALPAIDNWAERRSLLFAGIGQTYFSAGDYPNAREYYDRALSLNREVKNKRGEALALTSLGEIHRALGELEKAREYYTEALTLTRSAGDRTVEADALSGLSRVSSDIGNLSAARAQIEAALEITESFRARVANDELRASYLATKRNDYEFYVDLLMRLHEQAPTAGHDRAAFSASARARSLLDLLSEARVDFEKSIDPSLKQREREIESRFSHLQSELVRAVSQPSPDRETVAHLEAKLRQAENERDLVEADFRRHHPQYAELRYHRPLGLESIQRSLDEHSALLEYVAGEKASYLFTVTRTGFFATRLPAASTIDEQVRKLRETIATRPNRATLSGYLTQARQLYRQLIQPAESLITGKEELILAPDGSLHYLPFEVLLPSSSMANDLSRLPYLVRSYAISYAPSASVLAGLHGHEEKGAKPSKSLLAFADPVYGNKDAIKNKAIGEVLRSAFFAEGKPWQLTPLLYSRTEVQRSVEPIMAKRRIPRSRQEATMGSLGMQIC